MHGILPYILRVLCVMVWSLQCLPLWVTYYQMVQLRGVHSCRFCTFTLCVAINKLYPPVKYTKCISYQSQKYLFDSSGDCCVIAWVRLKPLPSNMQKPLGSLISLICFIVMCSRRRLLCSKDAIFRLNLNCCKATRSRLWLAINRIKTHVLSSLISSPTAWGKFLSMH